MVACTQPRRVAAEGVATRVAEINNVKLGAEVGFRVGFNSKTSGATRLVYMTDGLLLKEAENDRYLSRYSCVIVVEVHERGINTNLLAHHPVARACDGPFQDGRSVAQAARDAVR